MQRTGALLIVLLSIAGLSWWLKQSETQSAAVSSDANPRPDFFLNDFSIRQFSSEGALKYQIRGVRLTHFPEDDRSVIEQPLINLDESGGAQWQINASKAVAGNEENDEVWLQGEVKITQTHTENPTVLNTDQLLLKPGAKIARSDNTVTIHQADATTVAASLDANLNHGQFELTEVRSRYEP